MSKLINDHRDENGQLSFATVIFHDDEMTRDQKNYWLTHAANSLVGNEQTEAQAYLDKLNRLESEFIRI